MAVKIDKMWINKEIKNLEQYIRSDVDSSVDLKKVYRETANNILKHMGLKAYTSQDVDDIADHLEFSTQNHRINTNANEIYNMFGNLIEENDTLSESSEPIGQIDDLRAFDSKDPVVLIKGYGKMKLSQLKNKLIDNLDREYSENTSTNLKHFLQAFIDVKKQLEEPTVKGRITKQSNNDKKDEFNRSLNLSEIVKEIKAEKKKIVTVSQFAGLDTIKKIKRLDDIKKLNIPDAYVNYPKNVTSIIPGAAYFEINKDNSLKLIGFEVDSSG